MNSDYLATYLAERGYLDLSEITDLVMVIGEWRKCHACLKVIGSNKKGYREFAKLVSKYGAESAICGKCQKRLFRGKRKSK